MQVLLQDSEFFDNVFCSIFRIDHSGIKVHFVATFLNNFTIVFVSAL